METTSVGQRFTQLIQHLSISKNAFALSLDKTATVIQHLVEERNKPGFDLICKVFEVYPNVSKDWLLQGSGPMLTTSADEAPKQEKQATKPSSAAMEIPVAPVAAAEPAVVVPATAIIEPAVAAASAPATPAPAEPKVAPPIPEPVVAAVPVAPEPAAALPPVLAAAAAPAAPDAGAWQTALYTQQMAHQLALAELRNQHLQEQQRLMQQMMDLMQRKLT